MYVYRCYDADDVLLYVGLTCNVSRRMSGHRHNPTTLASRLVSCEMARYKVTSYTDGLEAERAEAEAIRTESPIGNLQCSGRPMWQQFAEVAAYLEHDRGRDIRDVGLDRCAHLECGVVARAERLSGRRWCSLCEEIEADETEAA